MAQILPGQRTNWTIAELEPIAARDEWHRYEIIAGELFVTRAPHWGHQRAIRRISFELEAWSQRTGLGEPMPGSGLVFSEHDSVIPDLVWIGKDRLERYLDAAGHLTGAPELVVEVLSAGSENQRRDREAKLQLYGAQGVKEYWLVDWRQQQIEVYRLQADKLQKVALFGGAQQLTSLLLPGFSCVVAALFA